MRPIIQSNPELDIRALGESLNDRGFFEVNISRDKFTWVNQFVLDRIGYELGDLQSMTMLEVIPSEFHDSIKGSIADRKNGRHFKHEVWPILSFAGDIIWWYVTELRTNQNYIWLQAEYLNKTGRNRGEVASMIVTMNTVQTYNDLVVRFEERGTQEDQKFTELEASISDHSASISRIDSRLQTTTRAAEKAANEAIAANTSIQSLEENFRQMISEQTAEIIRLISTDSVADQRSTAMETHLQAAAGKAVESAVAKITEQSKEASAAFAKMSRHTLLQNVIAGVCLLVIVLGGLLLMALARH